MVWYGMDGFVFGVEVFVFVSVCLCGCIAMLYCVVVL